MDQPVTAPTLRTATTNRGILAFVDGPLSYFHHDNDILESTNLILCRRKKRRKNKTNDEESCSGKGTGDTTCSAPASTADTNSYKSEYDASHSEFTLFFFADATNLNSIRLRTVIAGFIDSVPNPTTAADNDDWDSASGTRNRTGGKGCIDCICVPNNAYELETFLNGTGFWCLPLDHANRSAIIQLLAVSQVPSVVIVNSSTGRIVTSHGITAIQSPKDNVIEAWRRGSSGLSPLHTVLTATAASCSIS